MAMFSMSELGIYHPRYDSIRNKGSVVDSGYRDALASKKIVHYDDPKTKVRYSYAADCKFWIDGYKSETYYEVEARMGPSLDESKLSMKYLNAQLLHIGIFAPDKTYTLDEEDCRSMLLYHLSRGRLLGLPEPFTILCQLEQEYKDKFGEEPERPRAIYSGQELAEMFAKERAEKENASKGQTKRKRGCAGKGGRVPKRSKA